MPERRPGGGLRRSGLRADRRRPHAARRGGRPAAGRSGFGGDRARLGLERASLRAAVVIWRAAGLGRAQRLPDPVPVEVRQPVPVADDKPVPVAVLDVLVLDRQADHVVPAADQVVVLVGFCVRVVLLILASGFVTPGVVTPGVLAAGVVTPGVVTPGVLAAGVVTSGVVTPGVVTRGVLPRGVLASSEQLRLGGDDDDLTGGPA